jgi:hypothetical protein
MSDVEFDDVEVQRILERAAEHQQRAERKALVRRGGTSLTTLREIAAEVGIDPRHVDSAAHEVALRKEVRSDTTRLGVPRTVASRRVLTDEVDDTEWARIVDDVRRTFDRPGVVSEFGRVREWHSGTASSSSAAVVHLKLEEGEQGTTVSVSQSMKPYLDLPAALGATFGAIGVCLLGLLPVVDAPLALAAFAAANVATGLGVYLGGTGWAGRRARQQEERMEALLDRVELLAGSSEREG